MKRARQVVFVLLVVSFSGCHQSTPTASSGSRAAIAQEVPTFTTFTDLSLQPQKFNGRLVAIRARLEHGWEGDDFLVDPLTSLNRNVASPLPAKIWFHCEPDHEQQVYGAMKNDQRVLGLFTGYFHFVPDQKSRMKDVFDPGALQLDVIGFRP